MSITTPTACTTPTQTKITTSTLAPSRKMFVASTPAYVELYKRPGDRVHVVRRLGHSYRDYRLSGVRHVRQLEYAKEWYMDGKLHRGDDLPAIEHSNGDREWYAADRRHRDGGMPAIVDVDGGKEWYVCGKLHREGAGEGLLLLPAVEAANGERQWWTHGIRRGTNLMVGVSTGDELALPGVDNHANEHWAALIDETGDEWMDAWTDGLAVGKHGTTRNAFAGMTITLTETTAPVNASVTQRKTVPFNTRIKKPLTASTTAPV